MTCQNLTVTHDPHPVAPGQTLTISATGSCPAPDGTEQARFSLRAYDPAGNRLFDIEPTQGLDADGAGMTWHLFIPAGVMRGQWAYVVTLADDRGDEHLNVQGGFEVAG